jgi:hypothetical protein
MGKRHSCLLNAIINKNYFALISYLRYVPSNNDKVNTWSRYFLENLQCFKGNTFSAFTEIKVSSHSQTFVSEQSWFIL